MFRNAAVFAAWVSAFRMKQPAEKLLGTGSGKEGLNLKKMISRIASALCAAAMFSSGLAILPANAEEAESVKLMGDLDGDMKVTMADAKRALDLSVMANIGLVDKTPTLENDAADINMNGKLEMMDAVAIMNYYCQSMIGNQPMWSEIRKLTYHDVKEFNRHYDYEKEEIVDLPFALRGMYLEIGCAEGRPGETVTVPVYLAGIQQLAGFQYYQIAPYNLKQTGIQSDFGISQIMSYDENGKEVTEYLETDGGFMGAANLFSGAFIWVAENCDNISLEDGVTLAYYTYTIPEDAKPGEYFVLSVDDSRTLFGIVDGTYEFYPYQYTLLDGVIMVKE
jgi:hypothetical protein